MAQHEGGDDMFQTLSGRERGTPRVPIRTRGYYGWIMVIIAGIGVFFSGPGQTYGVSSFTSSYIHDLHMTRTQVSSLYSIATLVSGFTLFLVGRFLDKWGLRIMMTVAVIGLGVATLWSSFVGGSVMLVISFYLIRLFGQGSLTLMPSTLVSQWFIRYRGRALAFMSVGSLIGASAVPLINNALISAWGWHVAWRFWTVVLIILFAPLVVWLVRSKPEAVGLYPDGIMAQMDTVGKPKVTSQEESYTVSEAMRTMAFWLLLFCAFVPAMVNTGVTFNIYSVLGTEGISRGETVAVLGIVPLIGFVCTFTSGFLLERIQVRYLIALSFVLELIQMLAIVLIHASWMIVLFAVFWGLSQGLQNIAINISFANYYGRTYLGSINSLLMVATVVGSAFGPLPFGYGFDHFHSYQPILIIMTLFPIVAGVFAILAKQPHKNIVLENEGQQR